ncbi:MAG: hypothetical protein ACQEXJ_12345 [Myxococcota bacterium]
MPGLTVPMKPLADITFIAQAKRLSVDWSQPTGEAAKQYGQAFSPSEKAAVPEPMCYFFPVSTNKYHVDQAKDIGKKFKDLCHAMLDGFKKAVDMWKMQAGFQNLKVMAVSAIGQPGCLKGPDLAPLIKNFSLPAATGNEAKWRDAIADGLARSWKEWQDKVMVPGLPWYPAFAAFPGPMAPPMPNVPMPLIACPSAGMAKMMPNALKSAMEQGYNLDDPDDQFGALAQAIAVAVSASFMAWLPMQQVMLVMGQGPIPTFAPPFVPVGPVVNGQNLPGMHLMS